MGRKLHKTNFIDELIVSACEAAILYAEDYIAREFFVAAHTQNRCGTHGNTVDNYLEVSEPCVYVVKPIHAVGCLKA